MCLKQIIVIVLLALFCTLKAETELLVSAGVGLKDVFTEIAGDFEKSHPGVKVLLNFASAGQLMAQIEMGAPADILAVPGKKEIDILIKKNMIIPQTVQNFASGELVLIKSSNSKLVLKSLSDLQKKEVQKIAIGNQATVPAGKYAMQTLNFYKLNTSLADKFIPCENVRQVLDYVERNEVDAGFVYSTDAKIGKNIEIVTRIAPESHEKIVFPISIIKTSKSQKSAQEFIDYVIKSKDILHKYGFKD